MTAQAVTVHLSPDTLAALDRLAGRTEQSRSAIMAEAIWAHVADENAFHDSLDEADAEFECGEYITHEELVPQIRARRYRKGRGLKRLAWSRTAQRQLFAIADYYRQFGPELPDTILERIGQAPLLCSSSRT